MPVTLNPATGRWDVTNNGRYYGDFGDANMATSTLAALTSGTMQAPGIATQSSGPAGPSFPGGPYGAVDPYVAALNQQYLTDRLQQIEIPTLDLARSRQAFDIDLGNRQFGLQSGAFDLQRAQSDAAMTGYVPTQQMGRDAALDYLYSNSPQIQNLARVQGWNAGDPAARRNSMATYLKSVGDYFRANPGQAPDAFEQSILNYGGDPVAITSAMQAAQPQQSTFTRQQWQAGQDAARRAQQMQQAELLGYMPGPTADGLGNEPTYRTAVMPSNYGNEPMRLNTTGSAGLANEPTRRSLPSAGFSDGPPVTGQTFDTGGDDLSQFPSGTPTLAARQWQAANQLGIRAQNLAERRAGEDQAARVAGLTGQYNGQDTQAAQQQAFQQGIAREQLGLQTREQTLAEVAQAAQSGIAVRAQSLAEQRAADEQAGRLFGQGIAGRGQSLAELQAEREYGLGGRAQTLAEQRAADEQAARLFGQGIAGRGQSLAELTAEREYGLGGRAQTLAEQRAADEQAARLFGQGIAGRGQTLAELQAEREYGLGGRAQTLSELQAERGYGLQGRAQTLAEQEAARRGGLEAAALTGSYNGQATIAGRSLEEQVAARQAQDALRAAEMTGVYGGQQTLGAKQLGQQNEQFYAGMRERLVNTPTSWATYQKLQSQGAFGPMQATETYGDVGGTSNANWWQQAQADGRSGQQAGQQNWFSQPTSFKPQDWTNKDETGRELERGKWLAAGIRPEDAEQRMQNSWNTGTAARTSRWAA